MWRWRPRKKNRSDRLSKPPDLPTKTGSSSKETESSSPKRQICRQFTIAEIRSATQDFNPSLLIGRGGFSSVYKGTIEDGTKLTVAIKRLTSEYAVGPREFQAIVHSLRVLQHRNLMCFIGYCNDGEELILVYQYMPNGDLRDHLHKHRTPLSWSQRLKICIDVAHSLEYLHNGTSGQGVIYHNVKSADILLDDQWAAKIAADFGIIPWDNYSTHVSTDIQGRMGYVDPEYVATGRLSKKSDVYSFGVVLLEVLCRRSPYDRNFDVEERGLVTWALDCMKTGKLEKIIDPELKGQVSLKCLNDYARIVKCCLRYQECRATIAEVIFGLESILALHERTHNSISEMDITTSYWRLQKYFFYSGYFCKDLKSLSVTSHLREGDQRKSLYELMRLEYMQQADVLMRMKDFLHLIWSYPMKKEADVNFRSLIGKFSSLNTYIRKSIHSVRDENYLMKIQALVQDIEEDLNDAVFDMVAYLPEDNSSESIGFENGVPFASFWSGVPEVHASAIASATQRAMSCIKDLKVKKLGIWGSGADKVAERLKEMPELKRAFNVVLCVRVEHYSMKKLLKDINKEMLLWRKRSLKTDNEITDLPRYFIKYFLFLDCSDGFIDLHNPEIVDGLIQEFGHGTVHIVMTSGSQNANCPMDMEIRVEDHLLPWILFFTNADLASVGKYSGIQYKARHLMEICDGNLLAIILLARALRGMVKISAWDLAIHEFASQHEPSSTLELGVTGDVMVRVMRFIWSRMERLSQRCIMRFASRYKGTMLDKVSLIKSWIRDELVKTEEEGENVFEDLIRSFLIERVGGNFVRMRNQIQVIILTHFAPQAYGLYWKEDGSNSNRMPTIEEWDAREIHLSNNKISKLPDDPDCPILVSLFLNGNRYLMHIPITFFNNMPSLQALDLSGTSIKSLPSSISKLTTLQKFFIRDCDLLMELPPEIGALNSLKVFDSEGTQLMCLPEEFGLLTKLERLKLSLYNFPDELKQNNPSMQISLAIVLSNLIQLKELVVSVNSYGKWWEDEVKLIINILPKFQRLESLRLYFPTTELLAIFIETHSWRRVPIYQHLSNFGFVVGHLKERLISRVPDDLCKTFVKMPKCLTYTNGEVEGDTKVIASMLTNANALFLDRHWTVRSLSGFGLKEMERLKFCLLAECNEMLEIFNGSHLDDHSTRSPILGSLEHLSIHYMKSLTCILNRPIDSLCMPNLKTLTIHTCSELRVIFTEGLLDSLVCLEYLVVEDCERIKSLVSLESDHLTSSSFLPSLKKISLLDLPELVSISSGISIAPRLESLVVYDCPNLEELSYIKASGDYMEIKGEREWWDALKWCEPEWPSGQPDYLNFIALGTDGDITDELTDAVNLLPYLGMGESTKEAQTVEIITGPVIHYSSVKSASVKKLSQTPSKWWPTDKGKGKVSIHSRHVESVDDDITDELTDAVNLLPYLGMGESTKEPKQWK